MTNQERRYRELEPLTREGALQALSSRDRLAVADALFRLALYYPDATWVENLCIQYADDEDDELRRVAALSLGTLARVHGSSFESSRAFQKLLALVGDKNNEIHGTAEHALADIQIFRWSGAPYSRERFLPMLAKSQVDVYIAIFHVARHDPDTHFAWKWCERLLQDNRYPVRVAALWATADMWDRLDRPCQMAAVSRVATLLTDPHEWVRESARRVRDIMA